MRRDGTGRRGAGVRGLPAALAALLLVPVALTTAIAAAPGALATATSGSASSASAASAPAGSAASRRGTTFVPGPSGRGRYLLHARSSADYARLRAAAQQAGASVLESHGSRTLAMIATASAAAQVSATDLADVVVPDHVVTALGNADEVTPQVRLGAGGRPPLPGRLAAQAAGRVLSQFRRPVVKPPHFPTRVAAVLDPAADMTGVTWNLDRIRVSEAQAITVGRRDIKVAIADTGIDPTHTELEGKISSVVDFTATQNPPLCQVSAGGTDAELAAAYGGPPTGDWNGHGTWIAGAISANLDGEGVNGVAPGVSLISLKIAQSCGSTYDSALISAIEYATAQKVDILNISFGGYIDRSNPTMEALYQTYASVLTEARKAGVFVVAAAGNDHVRVDRTGQVTTHGSLTGPWDPVRDLYQLWQVPAGMPGVVMVSATNNVVAPPTAVCPGTSAENTALATCKRVSDPHQPSGVGQRDQLGYYSNYGPRIDLAAPGGARKFNLPAGDGGGTPGFPSTAADGQHAYQEFSITSNWGIAIICTMLTLPGFEPQQCYSSVQGTSMAAPQVVAVAALTVSSHPDLRHQPDRLLERLQRTARQGVHNTTQPLSATDLRPADLGGGDCSLGYCHLGGPAIPDREAYGAGMVDAFAAVRWP